MLEFYTSICHTAIVEVYIFMITVIRLCSIFSPRSCNIFKSIKR